ncbi:hypothetical protein ABW20_dc0100863 [Dactylellina cionopaga]|nr:hypothetical protein ABW20_dc0100863 [Dactylellina cionopaga]
MANSTRDTDEIMQDAKDDVGKSSRDLDATLISGEADVEIDNDKLPWGKKRPIKPRLIEDVLLPFPTEDQLLQTEDGRLHTLLANMKWMHKAQRENQRERHVREIKKFQKDLDLMIDWDIINTVYPSGQEAFKQFIGPIPRMSLNNPGRFLKPTPLDVLPAQYRSVLVQKDQFERLKRSQQKEKDENQMEVDEPEKSDLSIAELEFYVEDLMAEEIRKRKNEELELWMLQEDEKQSIYKTLLREQKRASLAMADSGTSKIGPYAPPLKKRPALPALRTNNLVDQLEGVTLASSISTKKPFSPRSATNERKRSNPFPVPELEDAKKRQVEERRVSASDIPENRLDQIFDRQSSRREISVKQSDTVRRMSKEFRSENSTSTPRRGSKDAIASLFEPPERLLSRTTDEPHHHPSKESLDSGRDDSVQTQHRSPSFTVIERRPSKDQSELQRRQSNESLNPSKLKLIGRRSSKEIFQDNPISVQPRSPQAIRILRRPSKDLPREEYIHPERQRFVDTFDAGIPEGRRKSTGPTYSNTNPNELELTRRNSEQSVRTQHDRSIIQNLLLIELLGKNLALIREVNGLKDTAREAVVKEHGLEAERKMRTAVSGIMRSAPADQSLGVDNVGEAEAKEGAVVE